MQTLLSIVHVVVSLFMILVILLQAGKSGGMGGLSGGSATVFGGRGSQTFLGKLTSACAAIFMVTSLTLAYMSSRSESMILQHAREIQEKAAAADTKTAVPADAKPAAPAEKPVERPVEKPAAAPAGDAKPDQK